MVATQAEKRVLLTANQVAEMLQVSRQGLHEWTKRGFMPQPLRIGTGPKAPLRWSAEELEAWIASGGIRHMKRADAAKKLRDQAQACGIAAIVMSGGLIFESKPSRGERLATDEEIEKEFTEDTDSPAGVPGLG